MDCVLHVGAQKTGSTMIQNFMAKRYEALRKTGCLYPKAGRVFEDTTVARHVGLRFAATEYIGQFVDSARQHNMRDAADFDAYRERFLLQIDREIKKNAELKFCVFSDEMLFEDSDKLVQEQIADILRPRFDTVSIVLYLRRPDDYFSALYTQAIKQGSTASPREFLRRKLNKGGYYPAIERWANVFGKENLSIRSYDRSSLVQNDIVADFCEVAGLRDVMHQEDIERHLLSVRNNVNPSLSNLGCQVLREINRKNEGVRSQHYRYLITRHFSGTSFKYGDIAKQQIHTALKEDHAAIVSQFSFCIVGALYDIDDLLEAKPARKGNVEDAANIATALMEAGEKRAMGSNISETADTMSSSQKPLWSRIFRS